jgi:transcriptional regulator with XRE-family HTH domain
MNKKGRATAIDILIGERVRIFRQEIRMSQEKLGFEVGVTFQQIQKYENGSNRISAVRLFQFSKILNVSLDEFFKGFEEKIYKSRSTRKK